MAKLLPQDSPRYMTEIDCCGFQEKKSLNLMNKGEPDECVPRALMSGYK